ncbi:MAG: MarR family transcriptional regulator [Lawsonibacter sp.]|jgi:DNA-binding MarR family transcriptional regulator|nr:MarR family transcriptional regulator [Lawsonibacter sp.]
MEQLTFSQFNEEACRMHKEEDGLYRRLARHFGLSDSALWILYALEASGAPVTQAELCGYLSLSKQTVNSGLKQLEQEGCIRLTNGPGRKKYLQLTGPGEQLTARTVRPVLTAEERAFLGLAEEERASLLALERKYLSLLLRESEAILNTPQEE